MSDVVHLTNLFKTKFSKELVKIGNKKGKHSIEIKLINENEFPSSSDIKLMKEFLINYLGRENWKFSDFRIYPELSMFVIVKFDVLL